MSRSWSAVCTLELWKTVSVITHRAYLRFQSPETKSALDRNAHHVRDLTTIYFPIVENMFRSFSNNDATSTSGSHGNLLYETLPNNCICTDLERLNLFRLWQTPSPADHICDVDTMIDCPAPDSPDLNTEQETAGPSSHPEQLPPTRLEHWRLRQALSFSLSSWMLHCPTCRTC